MDEADKADKVVPNPYDRFFRETFSRLDVARDFLMHYLPSELAARLDLQGLEQVPDSFVDEDLREHFSDLLYRVPLRTGGEAKVYLLFEHKSSAERFTLLQLLRYMLRIYCSERQEQAKLLTPIVPIVFSQTGQTWNQPLNFHQLVGNLAGFEAYTPDFAAMLFDLSPLDDVEVKGDILLRIVLLIMKHIRDDNLNQQLPHICRLFRQVAEQNRIQSSTC
jgi:predicted transposase/invertase (TIGR01784 family)